MAQEKSHKTVWKELNSGIVVPFGKFSDVTESSILTFAAVREKTAQVEQLFGSIGISIPEQSGLGRLINEVKVTAESRIIGAPATGNELSPISACFMDRIADAVLAFQNEKSGLESLSDLKTGGLDLLDRKRSKAKDTLWELELFAMLKANSLNAAMEEPPDIVVEFDQCRIGIACKKIYSEKHVQNVLSQAVAQIEGDFDFGIVAVNIDELIPPNVLLNAPTASWAGDKIRQFNSRFLAVHERHFQKYLSSGRLISTIISTTALTDVSNERARFQNTNEVTVWTIAGLPPAKDEVLKEFFGKFLTCGI